MNFYIRLFVNVVCKWCRRLPNLSWGKYFGGFTVYCCRTVNYGRIYLLLLWCTQQLIIDLLYCWLALQYIEESSWFIDWQFDCLFICLMFKKCLSKCHDKLAAKHIVFCCTFQTSRHEKDGTWSELTWLETTVFALFKFYQIKLSQNIVIDRSTI